MLVRGQVLQIHRCVSMPRIHKGVHQDDADVRKPLGRSVKCGTTSFLEGPHYLLSAMLTET